MGKFFSKNKDSDECIDCGGYYDMTKKCTFENRCKQCTKLYFKELQNHVLKNYCKHSDRRKKKKVKYLCYVIEDPDDNIMLYSKKNRKSMYSHKFFICPECEDNASYHYPVVIKDI